MRPGRSNRVIGTLRFRLALWNTVGLVLLGAGTMVALREGMRATLTRELNRLIVEDANSVSAAAKRYLPDVAGLTGMLQRKADSDVDRNFFGQVLTPDGRPITQSPDVPKLDWPVPPPEGPFVVGNYHVLQRTVSTPGRGPVIVRVGSETAFITDEVRTLTRLMASIGGLIVLIAPPIGYWLAGRACRPLQTIIDTTDRLRPGALAERLPIRGTGDELDQLSATINGFLDRLAAHLARQRDFVANAAHELRSPLAALRTSVEVVLERDRSSVEYQDLLAGMVEQVDALAALINQLLTLAEGDADRLRPSTTLVSLSQLANRAVDMFHGVADQRGVKLAVIRADPAAVRGDAAHLRQVIHNLLDNAIKFTPAGGRVEVEVQAPPGDPRVRLIVRDTGVGIAPADLPHVFDRFFRADRSRPRDGETTGTGLGLSICQTIMTAYGGKLDVASTPGEGTTVTADLPRAG